jgi:hypothetical protein
MHRTTSIVHGLVFPALVMLIPALMLGCAAAGGQGPTAAVASEPAVWYEGQQKHTAWPARDELAVFISSNASGCASEAQLAALLGPSAAVYDRLAHGLIFKIPSSAASNAEELDRRIATLKAQACVTAVGLVYYADARCDPATRLIHTDELIVRLKPSLEPAQIARLEADFGLTPKSRLRVAPNTMIYTVRSPLVVLETADRLHGADGVLYAYPNWLRKRVTK